MNSEQTSPAEASASSWREHAFRALVENLPEVVGCFDLQLRHLYMSPAIEAQTGVAASAFLGKTHAEFAEEFGLPASFAERWTEALRQVRETGEEVRFRFDFPISRGSTHFETRVVAQRDEAGRMEALLAITRAITPLSRMETEVQQLAAIVDSSDRAILSATLDGTILTGNPGAERLSSLATLIGGVAHELNNPLSAIKSFAQLMLLDERSAEDREALEIVHTEADRAAQIVGSLGLFARDAHEEHTEPPVPVDLNELVSEVLDQRRLALAARDVEVSVSLEEELAPVLARRERLELAVLNLVVNAEQALAEVEGARRLELRTRRAGDELQLQVSDTGRGIESEHLERIFDPFWTTRRAERGSTGLGLSLVHAVVSDYGGRVRVQSQPGQGSTFILELPAPPPAPQPRLK